MQTWEIWFADGRVEQHCRREQLSVSEMEALIGGYMDMQMVLCAGELRDMAVRWDAKERRLPVNARATAAWREALTKRGLSALPPDAILGDVVVLGYPLLRREVRPTGRLETCARRRKRACTSTLMRLIARRWSWCWASCWRSSGMRS